MAQKFHQGQFTPKNLKKYVGGKLPVYRSSWEKAVFLMLDNNPNIISWASEYVKIPYEINCKKFNYVPDILMKYIDKNGKEHVELIEIKPTREAFLESAKSKKDKIALAINQAKWHYASAWCKERGITFRIINENDIFGVKKK